MKHLKTYEHIKEEPQINDYVLMNIKFDYSGNYEFTNFINNNIGTLVDHFPTNEGDTILEIKYNNIPDKIKSFFFEERIGGRNRMSNKHLLAFGKTIEELNINLTQNKYNL